MLHWQLFLDVAQAGSLSKVALVRGVSQPHLSRQIAELEQQCGGRLFARTGRGVTLTDLGQRILPQVRDWLIATEQLHQNIRGVGHQPLGRVRLGTIPSMAHSFVSQLCQQVRQQYPLIELSVREGQGAQLEHWLGDGSLDLAILLRDVAGSSSAIALGQTETYLVGSVKSPLLKDLQDEGIAFRALHDLPLVSFCRPNSWRDQLEQRARKLGIHMNVVLEADSFALQLGLVEQSGVYALLGRYAIEQALQQKRIRAAKIIKPSITRHVVLAYGRTGAATPAERAVMQITQSLRV